MEKVNTKFRALLTVATCLPLFLGMAAPSSAQVTMASAAESNQLLDCMSIPKASLNVLYLMDVSASWAGPKGTDPTDSRSPMIASTLSMFGQMGQTIDKKVRYSFVQFGTRDDTRVVKNWTPLSGRNVQSQSRNVEGWAESESSMGTDWNAGLQLARNQIEAARRNNPRACFAMVWLTDGTLDLSTGKPHYVPQDFTSLNNICNESIRYFRSPQNNVTLIGALINSANSTPPYAGGPEAFKWIVSGSAATPVFIGKKENVFECGLRPNEVAGRFLSKATVSDLSWEFVDLIAELTGLRRANSDENPTISRPVARMQVYVKASSFSQALQVTDANGDDLCGLGKCRKSTSGRSATYWTVDIPASGRGSVSSAEEWKVTVSPRTPIKVFLGVRGKYKNLVIKASDGLSFTNIGEGTSVSGSLMLQDSEGTPADVADFDSIDFCLKAPTSLDGNCVASTTQQIENYQAASTDKRFRAEANFTIPGIEKTFKVLYTSVIQVAPIAAFPRLSCDDYRSIDGVDHCVLEALPNRFKKSQNVLQANVEQGSGSVHIVDFMAQDLPERSEGYRFGTDSEPIKVGAQGRSSVHFSLSNPKANRAVEAVPGLITYESTGRVNGQLVTVRLQEPVVFDIQQDVDLLALILMYVVALLIGIGTPYRILLTMARRKATFFTGADGVLRFITVPVKITSSGQIMSPRMVEEHAEDDFESGSSEVTYVRFETPDWRSLSQECEIPLGCKELRIGSATLLVSPIKFDAFAPVSATLRVPDALVFSNQGSEAWNLSVNEATADLNVNALIFFQGDAEQLQPTQARVLEESDDPFGESSVEMVTKAQLNNAELVGTLTMVLMGYPNARLALEKLSKSVAERNVQTIAEKLQNLRSEVLLSQQAEVQQQQVQARNNEPSPALSSSNGPVKTDDFDDFDDFANA